MDQEKSSVHNNSQPSFNQFHGLFLQEICHLQYLQILDLFGNNLSGPLSPCINNLTATAIVYEYVDNYI